MSNTTGFLRLHSNLKPLQGFMKTIDTLPKMIPSSGFLRDVPDHI